MDAKTQQFIRQLTAHQSRLYSFILSLLADPHAAEDVLQETNVVLWEKMDEAMDADSFTAWAYGVTRFKVLSHLRDAGRDRHIFDAELIGIIADDAAAAAESVAERRAQLEACLGRLAPNDRRLIADRYEDARTILQIAEQIGKSVAATKQALYRVRLSLLECIRRQAAGEDGA